MNTSISGGFLDSNWKQLYIQIAYIAATVSYTFVVTAIIAKAIDMIPGLHLRSTEEGESLGMDDIEVCRHSKNWDDWDFIILLPIDWRICQRLYRSSPRLHRLDPVSWWIRRKRFGNYDRNSYSRWRSPWTTRCRPPYPLAIQAP